MSLTPKEMNFNETWSSLKETVEGVITLGHVPRSIWNDRFSDVYSLCVVHYPEPLADKLYQETYKFLTEHVTELYKHVEAQGDNNLIPSYYSAWMEYSQGLNYVHKLYWYLNQTHIRKQKLSEAEMIYGGNNPDTQEKLEIGELGLHIWKKVMIMPLKETLVRNLMSYIMIDREGGHVCTTTPEMVRGCILSFVALDQYRPQDNIQLYVEIFEDPFLEKSSEYFKAEAAKLLEKYDVSNYMEKVRQKQYEEYKRSHIFLHRSSISKVHQRIEKHFVEEHLEVFHTECRDMIQKNRTKDLANMYPLLKRVPNGLSVPIAEFLDHVKEEGLRAVSCLKGDTVHIQFVENILRVYHKYGKLIEKVFSGDQNFISALDKSCSYVINYKNVTKPTCRSPELLAKYCDTLLKKSAKGISDAEIEEKLTDCIIVFKYLDDKDIFQKFYSRMLAKRLIHQQSYSMDAEEMMINRLKQACGYEFTNKLHRMYTDIFLSTDLNNKFNNYLKEKNHSLNINFQIYVLQTGAWPLGQNLQNNFAVPQELEKSVQYFEQFYHAHFSGRKLTWLHHLCQGELKLGYLRKTYIVTMQTYQMAILLLFEKVDSLTVAEILNTLQINAEQFQKHIVSLLECKLLNSNTEEITPNTILSLNFDFSSKRTKFRITAATQKESPQEVENTISSVEEDRKLYLQAAIVRIMKSRKLLHHNELIQEVLSQSKASFAPSIQMIKKCIEALIDKQYLERTPNSPDSYSYVA
ncbi:cullin-2 [Chrysoperla carnea]|uniref:cullin-2 n=1 Tax=Chrysoperla carnea TaxID=189513 RepID=UPI001D08B219|nr:cullin-2 [Chrysoperla carnea]XP_044742187.1 cullin-2 [Chrysoperla carnea]